MYSAVVKEPHPQPIDYTTFKIAYTPSLFFARLTQPLPELTVDRIVSHICTQYKGTSGATWFEATDHKRFFKIAFDYDKYLDLQDKDNAGLAACKQICELEIEQFMRLYDNTFDPITQLYSGQRHREVVHDNKQAFKISFRFYLLGYKVNYAKLKRALLAAQQLHNLFKDEGWDFSIYNDKRILNMPLCSKGKGNDMQPLLPERLHDGQLPCITHFFVSYISADDTELDFVDSNTAENDVAGTPSPSAGYAVHRAPALTTPTGALGQALLSPLPYMHTGSPFSPQAHQASAAKLPTHLRQFTSQKLSLMAHTALEDKGVRGNFRLQRITAEGDLYFYTVTPSRTCLQPGINHDSNNFLLRFDDSGSILMLCYSQQCRAKGWQRIARWSGSISSCSFSLGDVAAADMRKFNPRVPSGAYTAFTELEKSDKEEAARVKPLYEKFLLDYYNHFACIVEVNPPEVARLKYDMDGEVEEVQRFNHSSSGSAAAAVFENTSGTFKIWCLNPERNTKEGYEVAFYKPGQPHDPNKLNLAPAVPFMKMCSDDISEAERNSTAYQEMNDLILNTIYEQVCSRRDEEYQYVLNWLAHLVQRPGARMGVMLWLSGPQGSGKGWFASLLKPLLGKTWLMLNSMDRMTGKFNAFLIGKLLVVLDEASFNGSTAQADIMKNIITEPNLLVEEKHRNPVLMENHCNLLGLTNHSVPVLLDVDDRRHTLVQTSSEHAQDDEYWPERHAIINSPLAMGLFTRFLYKRVLSGWSPGRLLTNEVRQDAQLANRSTLAAFVQQAIENGQLLDTVAEKFSPTDEPSKCSKAGLKEAYFTFVDRQKRVGANEKMPLAHNGGAVGKAVADLVRGFQAKEEKMTVLDVGLAYRPSYLPKRSNNNNEEFGGFVLPSARMLQSALEIVSWWD